MKENAIFFYNVHLDRRYLSVTMKRTTYTKISLIKNLDGKGRWEDLAWKSWCFAKRFVDFLS